MMHKISVVASSIFINILSAVLIKVLMRPYAEPLRNLNPELRGFLEKIPNVDLTIFQSFPALGLTSVPDLSEEDAGELATILDVYPSVAQGWIDLARTTSDLPEIGTAVPSTPEDPVFPVRPQLLSEERPSLKECLPGVNLHTIKNLNLLGIKSPADMVVEDPMELSIILDLPAAQVKEWVLLARILVSVPDRQQDSHFSEFKDPDYEVASDEILTAKN